MPSIVTVRPDNIVFTPEEGETILAAGLKQKLNLPHSCKNGACSSCKCKVISGEVRLDTYNATALSDAEKSAGYTLLCKAHATTDVVLDIPNLLDGFPIKMMPSKVESIVKINHTAIITLKLPVTQTFGFYAGQYIDIMLKGKTRSYSIANSPAHTGKLELHVKYHANGLFSEFVWSELKADGIMRFKGPLGTFKLQKTSNPIIFVCTGTGFAPIKAIFEDMLTNSESREIHLYWGNRTLEDFYLLEQLLEWQSKLNLKVKLCLSSGSVDNYFAGYVTKAIEADFTNLAAFELYACGNQNMITDIFNLATDKLALSRDNFFSDAFIPSEI